MANLVCPLCGRRVNLASFDPTGYDLDITAVEVTGLGRGKGFKEVSNSSILGFGDPTVELIKNRILALSKMLLDSKCLTPIEVFSTLKIKVIRPKELMRRDEVITSLTKEVFTLKTQLDEKERNVRSKDSLMDSLNSSVSSLRQTIVKKDLVTESMTEEIISLQAKIQDLKEEVEDWEGRYHHRTQQARKLYRIAKSRGLKIEKLEEEIKDLTEQVID